MNARKIATIVILAIPVVMLLISIFAKLTASPQVVEGLTKIGFLPYFPLPLLGGIELLCVALFLIPKTWKIGFFLLCGYLGGAGSIEIAGHSFPVALVLLSFIWIGVYLRDKSLFNSSMA